MGRAGMLPICYEEPGYASLGRAGHIFQILKTETGIFRDSAEGSGDILIIEVTV